MGEVLCDGFGLALLNPSDRKGHDTYCITAIKGKTMGFIHIDWIHFVYIMSSCLRRYSIFRELNTLDACWIAVDGWSNSSRCRQDWSSCLGRDSYIHDHCLEYRHNYALFYQLPNSNLFTHHMLSSREKPLVKTMPLGSIFHHI